MSRTMTAGQLIDVLAACVTCGKEHKPRKEGSYTTWAARDGHPYRTRLYQMTGYSSTGMIGVLRRLADET